MQKTEKKYWVNGYRLLGSNFKTYSITIFNIGIMICWGSVNVHKIKHVIPYLKIYKLQ